MYKRMLASAIFLLLLIGLVLVVLDIRESTSIRDTFSTIELLKGKIQDRKEPQEVYKIIVELLGQPDRDIGSGLQILEWDLPSGKLMYSSGTGPIFIDAKGKATWLISTRHEVGVSIIGSYELTTPPDSFGTRYWLGNLKLRADGVYEYIDSNTNRNERQNQEDNFFINNPNGTYTIGFSNGVTEATSLEELADNTIIVELKFKAENDHSKTPSSESFLIYIDAERRTLNFKMPTNNLEMYQLENGWTSYSETP